MRTPQVYVLEGPDGVGKSTLASALCTAILNRGEDCIIAASPGREAGSLGELVYRLHHAPADCGVRGMSDYAKHLMHLAAQDDTITRTIVPALRAGTTIVLDRFWWSTIAYARAASLDEGDVAHLRSIAVRIWRRVPVSRIFLVHRDRPLRKEPLAPWMALIDQYQRLAAEDDGEHRVERIKTRETLDRSLTDILGRLKQPGARRHDLARQKKLEYTLATSKGDSGSVPFGFTKLAPAKPTAVYESYWRFAAERQRIFMARASGADYATIDPVLAEYKFTNAYRASDRVSQYLIRRVIYSGDASPREVFFRTLLFKLFNRIDTWELLLRRLQWPSAAEFTPKMYGRILSKAMADGHRIYSAAYIMPSGGLKSVFARKHDMHLDLLRRMLDDRLPERLLECRRLQDAFQLLRSYPTIGDFLAYQYVIDLNYGPDWSHSEMEFVVPGPGALDGIAKCFSDRGGLRESDLIRIVAEQQEHEFSRRGIEFSNLWGRSLQLVDCQNLFCEISKYARIAHPEIPGLTGRTRIKQRYHPRKDVIALWYPPKWGLNDRVPTASAAVSPVPPQGLFS